MDPSWRGWGRASAGTGAFPDSQPVPCPRGAHIRHGWVALLMSQSRRRQLWSCGWKHTGVQQSHEGNTKPGYVTRASWVSHLHPAITQEGCLVKGKFPARVEWRFADQAACAVGHTGLWVPHPLCIPCISNAAWLKINVQVAAPEGRLWKELPKRK